MQVPQRFAALPEYAFPRLRRLLDGMTPGGPELPMSIGEPKRPLPDFAARIIAESAAEFGRYPPSDGAPELRAAIAAWLERRYGVALNPDREIVSLNGTREGLFNAALSLAPPPTADGASAILVPNPFYQAYGAGAVAAGAELHTIPATAETRFLPNFKGLPDEVLSRTSLCYICSPSNPQGAVADETYWRDLIGLAERHDFRVLVDECYSEIYRDAPPPGALAVARNMNADPERVLIFQSLSKRSSAPGLRSGFAAGAPEAIAAMKQQRAYGGAPVPLPIQRASTALWSDETHVEENRGFYRGNFEIADKVLGHLPGYRAPDAGFFLWLNVGDGEVAALKLWREGGVRVLPGAYLGREGPGGNPGAPYIRVALVAEPDDIERGLTAIREILATELISEEAN